jgi:hypothetical protein
MSLPEFPESSIYPAVVIYNAVLAWIRNTAGLNFSEHTHQTHEGLEHFVVSSIT